MENFLLHTRDPDCNQRWDLLNFTGSHVMNDGTDAQCVGAKERITPSHIYLIYDIIKTFKNNSFT